MICSFKNTFFFFCFYIYFSNAFAKDILHQPIIGSVTETSAKIFFFSDTILDFSIVLKSEMSESKYAYRSTDSFFFTNMFVFKDLLPNKYYEYFITDTLNQELAKGSFTTFNSKNSTDKFVFTFGSCTHQRFDDVIFQNMALHQPKFFLHLGDWLYNNYNSTTLQQSLSLQNLKAKFIERYNMPHLSKLLQHTPIDYIFDDEDGIIDDFSSNTFSVIKTKNKEVALSESKYPNELKENLIQSLSQFFPSYNQNKNSAYHQFSFGNADFFFIDNRSTRASNFEIFEQKKNGKWTYKANKEHQILDSVQLQFLLDGLKNSTATWKFIVSGVTFNQSYKKVFDVCMRLQNRILPNQKTGMYLAASLSSMWFAFPATQSKLIDFCNDNNIENVIILSGDAHSAAIDDGKNAGFPEIMAGALAQENSEIASIIYKYFKMNLWNKGGQGIGNNNFNSAFGKVTVNGNESVQLSIIDDKNNEIIAYDVKPNFIPKKINEKRKSKITFSNKISVFFKKIRIGFHYLFNKK